jgi:hypothetical protein
MTVLVRELLRTCDRLTNSEQLDLGSGVLARTFITLESPYIAAGQVASKHG